MAFVPKRKKLLTRPVLKWEVGVPRYVKIEAAMHLGKDIKQKNDEGKDKEPPMLANVTDLETGEPAQIIFNAVLKSVLMEEYPNDAYVGKCFSIVKQERVKGKRYDPFSIEEIEDPNPVPSEPAPPTEPAQTPTAATQLHRSGTRR